jgi:hypothetical protein
MMSMTSKSIRFVLAAAACVTALSWNGELSPTAAGISTAQAIIGRPLTPMSFAGVARRTAWRGGYAYGFGYPGAYVGVPAPVVVGPAVVAAAPLAGCIQVVNAYGQVTYRC